MSRRTEIAYKAKFPGELAQHNEALGSGDMVNPAVVWHPKWVQMNISYQFKHISIFLAKNGFISILK
jgi:cell wall assembly regulator SMI1